MNITTIGFDLAKNVFQVHGISAQGKAVLRKTLKRAEVTNFFAKLRPCIIGMEACASAHFWARKLSELGHTVKLMAPQFVKPYVKSNKNDATDAEAICEAMSRPGMRFVSVKTVDQQDVQAVHRIRSELMDQRKAKVNQIRGLTAEYGLVAPREILHLRRAIPLWLEDQENGLSPRFRRLLTGLWDDLRVLDGRLVELDQEINTI